MTYVVRRAVPVLIHFLPFLLFSQQSDTIFADSRLKELVIQTNRVSAASAVPHNNFSAAVIDRVLQAQDVPYLLSSVPSLVESSDAGAGIGYTGLRIRGSDPTRVNVTLNGIPVNDAESQGMYWVDLPDLAASAAEIQVQRGVGASTNGAGAFGATVNIDLSKIDPLPGASVKSTLGSFGTRQISAAASTGLLHGKWAFSAKSSFLHSNGFIDRATTDLQSQHFSGAYVGEKQSLQFHFLNGREITYQAWNGVPEQFIHDERLRTFNSAGLEQPGSPYSDEVDHYTQRYYLLFYKRNLGGNWMLQLNGHFTRGFGYYEQYKAGQSYSDYGLSPWINGDTVISKTDLVRRLWLDNDFYGSTFALQYHTAAAAACLWQIGGGLSRYSGTHFGQVIWTENPIYAPKDYRYYQNDALKLDGNLYVRFEQEVFRGLNASIDLQERMVDYKFLGFNEQLEPANQQERLYFFNPKIGLNYSISNSWNFYCFGGIAHREPNRDDYTQSSPDSRPHAEKLLDMESGVKLHRNRLMASINLFWMQYRDQLVLDGRINDVGAYTRVNVPDSYRAGIELEAGWEATRRLKIAGNAAFSRNRIRHFTEYMDDWDTGAQVERRFSNTALSFSPDLVSRGEISLLMLEKHVRNGGMLQMALSLSGKYVGKQYLDNTSNELAILKPYFTSDARLNTTIPINGQQKLDLILAFNNILNRKYSSNGWVYRFQSAGYDPRADDPYSVVETGNIYHEAGYFPQAGRNWMLTVKAAF